MISIEKAVIARLKKAGETFEVMVDCDLALEYQQGKEIPLEDIIASTDIYSDAKKGMHAPENKLHEVLGNNNNDEIIKKIIKEGEVQLTAEHKNKLKEEKEKQIIQVIHRNAINPQTNTPHPEERIKNAIQEAKVKIDEFKSAEEQVKDIISAITPIIPIKYETRIIELIIPAQHAGQCMTILKRSGDLIKQDWGSDGSLTAQVKIPAGLQEELFDHLNNTTHGQMESRTINNL